MNATHTPPHQGMPAHQSAPPDPPAAARARAQAPAAGAGPVFRRILLPTDGSPASQRAIAAGVAFARELGAEVVGLSAVPSFRVLSADPDMLEDTPEQYALASAARARAMLAAVERAARAAGVPCRLEQVHADRPHEAIIDAAARLGCDLIMMASHGRRGLHGLLLGSETERVLVHGTVPVLVHR